LQLEQLQGLESNQIGAFNLGTAEQRYDATGFLPPASSPSTTNGSFRLLEALLKTEIVFTMAMFLTIIQATGVF
jgi:hypothetical protein